MRHSRLGVVALIAAVSALLHPPEAGAARAIHHYVDCSAGDDASSGTSAGAAWRTLARANEANLLPGDELLLRRGCTWDGQRLEASWRGRSDAPILISAYGTGSDPQIKNGPNQDVLISGAWQIIEHLTATVDATKFTSCGNPIGVHYGFNLVAGAHDNTVRYSSASREEAGVHLAAGAYQNHILNNVLSGNSMMAGFNADPEVDQGAWGILLNGDRNEIAYNDFFDNRAVCRNGAWRLRSKSINIYEATGNVIHHNRSSDRVFAELGSSSSVRTKDTTFQYNVFSSSMDESRFVTTRGAGDTRWGPVLRTRLDHNSTYQTASDSLGVSCASGCDGTVLSTNSNVIWANGRGIWADKAFSNRNDIFWSSSGDPEVTAPGIDPSTRIANPLYLAPSVGDLRVQPASPAIDGGEHSTTWTTDAWGVALPQGRRVDVGAAEHAPDRVAGIDRIDTGIVASRHTFATPGSAQTAVIASSAGFADALPAVPLAHAKRGPLLLTPSDELDARTASELQRAVPAGQTVYLVGGQAALSEDVEAEVRRLGYAVTRYGGSNRFATAVLISELGLGNPTTVLEASGLDFPDALAGGAAASKIAAAVLLTDGRQQALETAAYLALHRGVTRYAVGGPAAAADPGATAIVGSDRYATTVAIATRFFSGPTVMGIASGQTFPDALSGGVHVSFANGPMLLVPSRGPLPASISRYLSTNDPSLSGFVAYGGPVAVGDDVVAQVRELIE